MAATRTLDTAGQQPDGTASRGVVMRSVTKRYGALVANDDISLTVDAGTIHVLVGENGAGKSTLMSVLAGAVDPDEGAIMLDGDDITSLGPRQRIERGIGMVHQHFQLVDVFTVAENVALGAEPTRPGGRFDLATARATALDVSTRFGLPLDPDDVVGELPIGLQQRVEIVKVLTRDADVLIFDEPTAVLTDDEAAELFAVMRSLRDDGRTIVFITHKLRDALALGDQISVLRRGQLVATLDPATTTVDELGTLMVGREIGVVERRVMAAPTDNSADPGEAGLDGDAVTARADRQRFRATDATTADEPVLSLRAVSTERRNRHEIELHDVDFDVHRGEIVGVLGVEGNGQHELIGVLTGRRRPDAGTVVLDGTDMTGRSSSAYLRAGLGVVPADRHRDGLVLSMPIDRNLVLDRRHERQFVRCLGMLLDDRAVRRHAESLIERYDVRTNGPGELASALSGGNQQKVVLARELERTIKAVVVAHPTRGLDVGSIEYVHTRLIEVADAGCGVAMITSDIDEALALSDRIVVLCAGRVVGVVGRPFSRERIGVLMGGGDDTDG